MRGRKRVKESMFYKHEERIKAICPHCIAYHTHSVGKQCGSRRFRCNRCGRVFYLSKDAKEVK